MNSMSSLASLGRLSRSPTDVQLLGGAQFPPNRPVVHARLHFTHRNHDRASAHPFPHGSTHTRAVPPRPSIRRYRPCAGQRPRLQRRQPARHSYTASFETPPTGTSLVHHRIFDAVNWHVARAPPHFRCRPPSRRSCTTAFAAPRLNPCTSTTPLAASRVASLPCTSAFYPPEMPPPPRADRVSAPGRSAADHGDTK